MSIMNDKQIIVNDEWRGLTRKKSVTGYFIKLDELRKAMNLPAAIYCTSSNIRQLWI